MRMILAAILVFMAGTVVANESSDNLPFEEEAKYIAALDIGIERCNLSANERNSSLAAIRLLRHTVGATQRTELDNSVKFLKDIARERMYPDPAALRRFCDGPVRSMLAAINSISR